MAEIIINNSSSNQFQNNEIINKNKIKLENKFFYDLIVD